jgi:putative transposase
MRTTRFSETEIIYVVKHVEMGISVKEIARKYGVCENTVYRWRRKYDGLSPSELRRLKELERENSQLKKLVAELSLDKEILQDVLRKNSEACTQAGSAL